MFVVGLVNFVCLREYPKDVGLEIKEQGNILNPSQADDATETSETQQ